MESKSLYKPLEVELMEVAGLRTSMLAMRLPKVSENDSVFICGLPGDVFLGEKDSKLAGNLIRAGDDHAKAMRGIIAWVKMKMQVGWMVEFETYRHGVECLSTSSTMHGELKGMSGPDLAEVKQAGLAELVYIRYVAISYQALRSIYRARRGHRHPDWKIFCNFIETLPYFKELIYPEVKKATLQPPPLQQG